MTAQEMQLQLMLGEARMENDRLNWKLAELQQDLDLVRPYPVRNLESFREVLGN